ncbi:MAG: S8 family serine peptidase [Phycisphaerales bacterium]
MDRRLGRAAVVLAVAMAAGSPAFGQARATLPAQSLRTGLDLSPSDLAILDTFERPPVRFVEKAGVRKFSGKLLAKVRTVEAFAGARPGERVSDAAREAGEVRASRARARLTPSMSEAFPDVDEYSINIPAGWDADSLSAFLMATGDYEYAEPDWLVYPALAPNDPQLGNQQHHTVMHSRDAWDYTTGDPTMVVGVCDTGVDTDHPDLQGALLTGFNAVSNLEQGSGGIIADFNGHGTATTGAAAAIGNNGVGVVGMGWNFMIRPVKVSENPDGTALISDLVQGARWASDNGARVVSVSFGGVESSSVNNTGTHIKGENHLLCWAAGNEGSYLGGFDWPDVIVVGASTNGDGIAGFSNFGPGIDIVAPGVNIRTTANGGGYGSVSGTSLSTPLINGLLALIWSTDLSMTADEVEQLMYDQAVDVGTAGEDDSSGHGRADAGASVRYAATGEGPRPLPFTDDFESGLDPHDWTTITGAATSSAGENEPSGSSSLSLTSSDEIISEVIRAHSGMSVPVYVSFWAEHQGVPSGGTLTVETLDVVSVWRNIATIVSDGTDSGVYGHWIAQLSPLAAWDSMRLRIRATGPAGGEWFVDDVRVGSALPIGVPVADNYEGNLDTISLYASNTGAAISNGATDEPSGSQSLAMAGNDVIETFDIPMQSLSGTTQYARIWAERSGVPNGGSLYFEYKSVIGTWQVLAQLSSDGVSQSEFELAQVTLPELGFWDGLRVRLRRTSGAGTWYVDDLYVGPDELVLDGGCNIADLAEPHGTLDFSDVISFLTAFGSMDPAADFASPTGVFDFSDVIAFLSAFGAGCP